MAALVFQRHDPALEVWISQHSSGFVISVQKLSPADYIILHRASCTALHSILTSNSADSNDSGKLIVCAPAVKALRGWIATQGISDFSEHCESCEPLGPANQRRCNWSRDELILALDLYHSAPAARGNMSHPGIAELSELLQELPIHPAEFRPPNFRNPNGVAMKLGNFLAYDPAYQGAGLKRGARLEQSIWSEFASDLTRLRQLASAIREHYPTLNAVGAGNLGEDDGVEEGGILFAMHMSYERDKSIIRKKKKYVFEKAMALRCEVCDFDFAEVYGDLGHQFAECHHTKPVSLMKHGEKTKLSDLSIVCANCHRMLHREPDLLTVERLKKIVEKEATAKAIKGTFI